MIGQNETETPCQDQQEVLPPVIVFNDEKKMESGSRLSNGGLNTSDHDSAARVIDLQSTVEKQVRIITGKFTLIFRISKSG